MGGKVAERRVANSVVVINATLYFENLKLIYNINVHAFTVFLSDESLLT